MFDYLQSIKENLFIVDLIIHYILLIGIVWSVAFQHKRIWPPPKKSSWQYTSTWFLFYLAFILNGSFIFLDWNTWLFNSNARFLLGIPIAIIGALLVSWGIFTLGVKNTSGRKDGFMTKGPYRFTRNPQYFGDMLLFIGLILISNSLFLLITNMLLILVFAITPLAEEIWLEETYGDEYKKYKTFTSRFL
jgi:protein-S-isoprenylcysteine O-methyltransferase Ste14